MLTRSWRVLLVSNVTSRTHTGSEPYYMYQHHRVVPVLLNLTCSTPTLHKTLKPVNVRTPKSFLSVSVSSWPSLPLSLCLSLSLSLCLSLSVFWVFFFYRTPKSFDVSSTERPSALEERLKTNLCFLCPGAPVAVTSTEPRCDVDIKMTQSVT